MAFPNKEWPGHGSQHTCTQRLGRQLTKEINLFLTKRSKVRKCPVIIGNRIVWHRVMIT